MTKSLVEWDSEPEDEVAFPGAEDAASAAVKVEPDAGAGVKIEKDSAESEAPAGGDATTDIHSNGAGADAVPEQEQSENAKEEGDEGEGTQAGITSQDVPSTSAPAFQVPRTPKWIAANRVLTRGLKTGCGHDPSLASFPYCTNFTAMQTKYHDVIEVSIPFHCLNANLQSLALTLLQTIGSSAWE